MLTVANKNTFEQTPGSSMGVRPIFVPAVVAIVSALAVGYFGLFPAFTQPVEWSQFGGTLASVGVTMLGFMLAALAVVASINHTHLVSMMRKTGHYPDLLATLFAGCVFFLFCALEGFVLLFGMQPNSVLLSITIGTHLGALVALLDVGRKLWLVLTNLRS